MKRLGKYNDLGVYICQRSGQHTLYRCIMFKYVYNDILKKNAKQSTIKMGMSYVFMFQQENNSNTMLS